MYKTTKYAHGSISMMITQWFSLFEKEQKRTILKNKMKNVRCQLIKAVKYNDYERRDKLLATYEILLIEFENV
ncbi:hypothetical protein UA38_20055 [Photobacterium kishitanii]|uniref:Uncharacterized protein n=1 Tax=Photobacterium kishitanii TaxID=318456 RepID=A0AAX0YPN8_9GAMM|nr:hypothetical protein UA38_20055 [Photobacterium kishitanii]KJG57984.1 hypothetical protein UA42_20575 [Photobacterium kishitanii]KJG63670.1 hypothetical protein UA40_20750 [Photobacterium kishitanii]KJG66394.1 hypothetical protein UA41_20815 [Photobacterium kishitanii]PSX16850.1 hypothetical protein C0W70_22340 [Photobacterium kishitanii]